MSLRAVSTALPPVVAFAAAVGAFFVGGAGWQAGWRWWRHLDGGTHALLAAGLAVAVFMLVTMVMLLLPSLTRLYEGYWGSQGIASRLRAIGVQREAERLARLRRSGAESAYQRRYMAFPPVENDLRPTRLGNALAAAEAYPGDQRRYGVDAVFFWPRLYPLLPDGMRDALTAERSTMDTLLLMSAFAVLFAAMSVVAGLLGAASPGQALLALAAGVAVSRLAYLGAVRAGRDFGELVRACFDVYRRDLLTALGFSPPATLEEERVLWRAVAQQLYRRAAEDAELLRMRTAAPSPGPVQGP